MKKTARSYTTRSIHTYRVSVCVREQVDLEILKKRGSLLYKMLRARAAPRVRRRRPPARRPGADPDESA